MNTTIKNLENAIDRINERIDGLNQDLSRMDRKGQGAIDRENEIDSYINQRSYLRIQLALAVASESLEIITLDSGPKGPDGWNEIEAGMETIDFSGDADETVVEPTDTVQLLATMPFTMLKRLNTRTLTAIETRLLQASNPAFTRRLHDVSALIVDRLLRVKREAELAKAWVVK